MSCLRETLYSFYGQVISEKIFQLKLSRTDMYASDITLKMRRQLYILSRSSVQGNRPCGSSVQQSWVERLCERVQDPETSCEINNSKQPHSICEMRARSRTKTRQWGPTTRKRVVKVLILTDLEDDVLGTEQDPLGQVLRQSIDLVEHPVTQATS